jgi:mRNA interferase MazF
MVNFNPGRGTEQKGIRPSLILQNDTGNQYSSTTIVAAITSTLKKYPVTVILDKKVVGLESKSMVNLSQILTIDKGRLIQRMGIIGGDKMREVDEAIKVSLGLED